jgi:agmatinase
MTPFGLVSAPLTEADVVLLPLPFEGTVSYGGGTAAAPAAILAASAQVELFDEETLFDLASLAWHLAPSVTPRPNETPDEYLSCVHWAAASLIGSNSIVIGIGGEHSVTPPLVKAAACGDYSGLTVVQFDAHADLRDEYEGTPNSHACAMRRLVDAGAHVIGIGIRSLSRDEAELAKASSQVEHHYAHSLGEDAVVHRMQSLSGRVYITIDVDALDVALCPGTGTPEPGGLSWQQTTRILNALLSNPAVTLIGGDIVEAVPQEWTQVNEFVAARLLAKLIAYNATGARTND